MNIEADQVYRHFKGNIYKVITLAKHSETGEEMVVYRDVYGSHETYVRPREMFESPVDRQKYPDAEQEMRFELMDETEAAGTGLKPLVEAFLDADGANERMEILKRLQDTVNDDDIDIMAGVMDFDIGRDHSLPERYKMLMDSLSVRGRFETNRLR